MANKKVVVTGNKTFFNSIMDETAVAAYVAAAVGTGHFISDEGDIYIPVGIAEVTVENETYTQSSRQEANNFGPSNLYL